MREQAVIRHEDPAHEAAMLEYCSAIQSGLSAFVSPEGLPFDEEVRAEFEELVLGQYLVTSLRRLGERMGSPHGTHHDGHFRRSLTAFRSSGSSGSAKTVLYFNATLMACAKAIARRMRLADRRHSFAFVPQEFAYGLSIIHSHLLADAVVEFRSFKSAADVLSLLEELARAGQSQGGLLPLVYTLPHQLHEMSIAARDWPGALADVEFVVAGGMLPQPVAERLSGLFAGSRITNMYGQAELGPRVATWSGALPDFREGLIGEPLEGVELIVTARESGDGGLSVLSPYRMLGYLAPTKAAVEAALGASSRAWPTGDLVRETPDGGVVLSGRQTHAVNVGGVRLMLGDISRIVASLSEVTAFRVSSVQTRSLGTVPHVEATSEQLADAETIWLVRSAMLGAFGPVAKAFKVTVPSRLETSIGGKRW